MFIGIDIDEVLGDFITPFIAFHNQRFGTDIKYEDVFDHDFETVLKLSTDEIGRRISEFFDTEGFKELRPVDGSIDAVKKLSEEHKLVVITGRPSFIIPQTKEWLHKNFGGRLDEVYYSDVFLERGHKDRKEKYEHCLDLGVELLIDDHQIFSYECASHGIKVLLFSHPWNRNIKNHENITRIYNWAEILEQIDHLEKVAV